LTRRSIIRIALLPIFAPIFLIGWVLANIGKQNLAARKAPRPIVFVAKKEGAIEIGLLAEDKEELIIA
jgi:hypothetical protein